MKTIKLYYHEEKHEKVDIYKRKLLKFIAKTDIKYIDFDSVSRDLDDILFEVGDL